MTPASSRRVAPPSVLRAGMKNISDAMAMATVPSSMSFGQGNSPDQPGSVNVPRFRSARNTQSRAVVAKTVRTARSSKDIGPRRARSASMSVRSAAISAGARYRTWVISNQATSSMMTPTGKATMSHWPNAISGAFGKHDLVDAHERQVGRRAHQGGHAAGRTPVGDAEHETGRERLRAVAGAFFHLGDDGQAYRHHRHSRCGVRDPHGQERRRDHETQHDAGGPAADVVDDAERDAPVQVPLLHGQGDHEAADEQHDGAVDVDGRRFAPGHDAEQWEQDQRHQRGGEQRDGFGDPPDRHECRHRGKPACCRVGRVDRKCQQQRERRDSQPETEYACLVPGGSFGHGFDGCLRPVCLDVRAATRTARLSHRSTWSGFLALAVRYTRCAFANADQRGQSCQSSTLKS